MEFKRFEVTKNHIKLLKRMYVIWDDGEYMGSPSVSSKRPYGDSDVLLDVAEIIGMVKAGEDVDIYNYPEDKINLLKKLHLDMEIVLQICVSNNGVKAGIYETTKEYDSTSWRLKRKSK